MMSAEGGDEPNDWDSIVRRHAQKVKKARERMLSEIDDEEETEGMPFRARNAELTSERYRLEERIRAIIAQFNTNAARLADIKATYDEKRTQLVRQWEAEDEESKLMMEAGPDQAEGDGHAADGAGLAPALNGTIDQGTTIAASVTQTGNATAAGDRMAIDDLLKKQQQHEVPVRIRPELQPAAEKAEGVLRNRNNNPPRAVASLATVVSAQSQFIGQVERLAMSNDVIESLLKLPVQRDIIIKEGRKFTLENLEAIYDGADPRATKWVACMIQATGEIQRTPCEACVQLPGVFAHCIRYNGPNKDLFFRCGNCEWAYQNCRGSSLYPPLQPAAIPTVEVPGEDMGDTNTGGFTAVNAPVSKKPNGDSSDAGRENPPNGMLDERPPRRSLPDGKLSKDTPLAKRFPKSPSGSEAGTPRADESDAGAGHGDNDGPPLPEITRSVLALRHNGDIYTAPEIMVGVPVRKIDESDTYWDPAWTPLIPKIEEHLRVWQGKLDLHTQNAISQTEGKRTKHAQFLANRQVNRGRTILDFLGARENKDRVGDINPYQLVAKQFINAAYINYDTIYRLVATLEELKKFSLDVTPVEWVRQRLHEIQQENPLGFQLSKVVADLYHDPKLQSLRSKNGYGNIGRPSGTGAKGKPRTSSGFAGAPPGTGAEVPGSARKPPRAEKRKEPHITPTGTPVKILPAPVDMVFMRRASNQSDAGFNLSVPTPPESVVNTTITNVAPSEAVQSYREVLRRTQEAVDTHSPRAEQNNPSDSQQPAPPASTVSDVMALSNLVAPNSNKKPRLEPPLPAPGPVSSELPTSALRVTSEDTQHDGYTSVDSYSGDGVMPLDWRLGVVKTWERSSGSHITQYWHWVDKAQVDDGSEANFFEHQVLSELKPPDWGVYKDPINFHLRLRELQAVVFAHGSLRIVIVTKPVKDIEYRGDVLAEFKRERTKRRLLKFMRNKDIKLVKTNAAWINDAWERVNPMVLPSDDSDE